LQQTYLADLAAWREEIGAGLRKPYSWLALCGLHWLAEGDNPVGSAAGNAVQLPARAPEQAGIFTLANGEVTLKPAPDAGFTLNDKPLTAPTMLHNDHAEHPDFVFLGDIRMLVLRRADQYAVRVWDPQRLERELAVGRVWFPPDESAKVTARIERYDPPKRVVRDDITGIQQEGEMHAVLHFDLDGEHCAPEAELLDDGTYYLLIKDGSCGKSTYGSGRFLVSEPPVGDEVVLDFNKAYSPPCAFTEFATCPLPSAQNTFRTPILAGERYDEAK
jgi:uncharacterized protein (DUF1684 family)